MKLKILLISVLLSSTMSGLKAQSILKIGHVNIQELVQKHPDMDSIRALVQQETKDLEEVYAEMLAEYENKIKKFEGESAGYSDFMKDAKQTEIVDLEKKIENYRQNAEQQLQQRNRELITPIYTEINEEIANIAAYNKFTYILDVSNGTVAYISPESEDITALVSEKLLK